MKLMSNDIKQFYVSVIYYRLSLPWRIERRKKGQGIKADRAISLRSIAVRSNLCTGTFSLSNSVPQV